MIKNKEKIVNQVILNEQIEMFDLLENAIADVDSGKCGARLRLILIRNIITKRINKKREELNKKR